jgi:hypothetical protein
MRTYAVCWTKTIETKGLYSNELTTYQEYSSESTACMVNKKWISEFFVSVYIHIRSRRIRLRPAYTVHRSRYKSRYRSRDRVHVARYRQNLIWGP